MRVFPISNWTELDVWQYIAREELALPSIYYAHKREVVRKNGLIVPVTNVTPKAPGEVSEVIIVRFLTVDDGKRTLIGHLLYDTKAVLADQLLALSKTKYARVIASDAAVDLALLTDGLKAEREQGIMIDMVYRYFAISKCKFILADSPGHEQYTRNLVTGASQV